MFAFGNWSKFVRPGYVMIGISNTPINGVYCTAFKNPVNGEFAIIMINKNKESVSLPVKFSNVKVKSLTPWVTSEKYNLEKQNKINPSESGKEFIVNLEGYSITTYVGTTR